MGTVIKKDQSRQEFDGEKIKRSIEEAAKEAEIEDEEIEGIASRVSGFAINKFQNEEEVQSSAIRETVLTELDTVSPKVSKSWRKYDQENKAVKGELR